MNHIDWGLAGQYTVWSILTGVAIYLWILLANAANRADERDWERQTLRTILKYVEEEDAKTNWCDCANEPDLEFQLRRSVEMQQEKIDNNRPLAS